MERKLPIVLLILGILLALMVPVFVVINSLYGKRQTKPATLKTHCPKVMRFLFPILD
jgi:hypothetical protein